MPRAETKASIKQEQPRNMATKKIFVIFYST